jgi:putative endopeptidase
MVVLAAALWILIAARAADAPVSKEDFLRANMDISVDPGVDFFSYANATWLRQHPIPASESAWGIGNMVREERGTNLRTINEQAAATRGRSAASKGRSPIFDHRDGWARRIVWARPLQAELTRIDQPGARRTFSRSRFIRSAWGHGVLAFRSGRMKKDSDTMAFISPGRAWA